jgi:hypothetical protein
MITEIFEFETALGTFRDALHLEDDHTYTADEIQAMKQERLDNWNAIVNAPPPPPTPEDSVVDSIPADAITVEDSPVGAI